MPRKAGTAPCLGDTVHRYLTFLQGAGRSAATQASYAASLRILGDSLPSTFDLRNLTTEVLACHVASLSHDRTRTGAAPSEVTLNRHRSAYRTFAKFAFTCGWLPARTARLPSARVQAPPTPPISMTDVSRLLSANRASDEQLRLRDEALPATYAFTGLRRNEALALRVAEVDWKNGCLRVMQGKGRRPRAAPMARQQAALLARYRGECLNGDADGPLFPGRQSTRALDPRQADARFAHWRGQAGLSERLTIRSFRVGFATALYQGCGDLTLVSCALGHQDLRPVLRYVQPSWGALVRVVEECFGEKLFQGEPA